MRCPFCGNEDTQVKDSRPADDGASIRRRRECAGCGGRFTTFERIQLREITVIKAGGEGRREPFERDKLVRSLRIALRKRPVSEEQIEKAASSIVRQMETLGESEVTSQQIGEYVMHALARLDTVAYIRYASVYKAFSSPGDFNEFLDELKSLGQGPRRTSAEH